MPLPFLHTTLRQKWGEGICSNSLMHMLPPSSLRCYARRWQSRQLPWLYRSWRCTTGNQRCLSWYQAERRQSSGDRGRPCISSYSGRGYSDFMCTCLWTHSMTELNQTLTKSMPKSRRHLPWGVYTREKYLCKISGLKREEVFARRGVYFRELTVSVSSLLPTYM